MIEFNGYISGAAEKRFMWKSRKFVIILFLFAIPFSIPIIFSLKTMFFKDNAFIYTMLACFCIIPFMMYFLPQSKNTRKKLLPKRIYTKKDEIICVAEQYTESKFISDVSKVIDHGEFYELCFPFGKVSDKFICQKNLLTRGTIKEFERLFDGKIVRKLK